MKDTDKKIYIHSRIREINKQKELIKYATVYVGVYVVCECTSLAGESRIIKGKFSWLKLGY